MTEGISYEDAALLLGCDHHWVRMLTSRGVFDIVERIEVKPNVLKVFINRDQVEAYREDHRERHMKKYRLTRAEQYEVEALIQRMRR